MPQSPDRRNYQIDYGNSGNSGDFGNALYFPAVVEAPGLLGEVRLAARAVKKLISGGMTADNVVITARDPATQRIINRLWTRVNTGR